MSSIKPKRDTPIKKKTTTTDVTLDDLYVLNLT